MLLHIHPEDRMSLTGVTTFLLLLVTTTSAQSCTDLPAALSNVNTTANTNYSLTVSPTNLTSGTVYTVTLNPPNGTSSSITIFFKAASNNSATGTWSVPAGFTNCSDGFSGPYISNSSLAANWTSPAALSATNVTFSFVLSTSGSYSKLERVITTILPTTTAPTTTAASMNGTTVKSGGPTHQPMSMFLALIETLTLLVLTSKLLT